MFEFIRSHSQYSILIFSAAITYPILYKRRKKAMLGNAFEVSIWCLFFTVLGLISTMLLSAVNALLRGRTYEIGSIAIFGEFIFLPVGLFLAAKIRKIKPALIFDVYIIWAVPVIALMRVNCILSGCCLGLPIPGSTLRWPVRELEIVFFIIMWIILLKREKNNASSGSAFPLVMMSYGAFRFLIEFFRVSPAGTLFHIDHLWAALSFIVGAALFLEITKKKNSKKMGY